MPRASSAESVNDHPKGSSIQRKTGKETDRDGDNHEEKKNMLSRAITRRSSGEKKNIRQFRAQRDMGLMGIMTQARAPQKSRRRRHNPAMMEYEMRRHADEDNYQSSEF